jgi:hypothetical protein
VVTQAEFNGGTFGGVANEVWFRYVSSGDNILGLHINEGGNFGPQITLYRSDGTTSILFVNRKSWWLLLNTDTFYLKIKNTYSGSTDFDFTCQFEQGAFVSTPISAGSFIINDDSIYTGNTPYAGTSVPGTVWETDGTFLGFARTLVSGELGDALPNGTSIWHNRFGGAGNGLKLFDSNLTLIATTDIGSGLGLTASPACFCNDGTNFYILVKSSDQIYNVSSSGVVSSSIATLTGNINAIGVSRNGQILYYTIENELVIRRWDLVSDTALSDLYNIGIAAGNIAETPNTHSGEIIVLSDDSLVTWYRDTSNGVYTIIHVSSAGTLLNSYAQAAGIRVDHIHYNPDNPNKVNVWLFLDNDDNSGRFGELTLATGTISPTFDRTLFQFGVNLINADDVIFGPSTSCAFVTLNYESEPPPAEVGTIIVVKVCPQSPAQDFTFDAVNLSPTTFILSNGEQQIYTDVPAGSGYSVIEQAVSGYTTTYSVSNGSSNTNITVANGETVTVTVTNTVVLLSAGGIYQIVPGKREDTLWVNFPNDTVDVKIPDPFARTGYLGE